MAPGCPPLPARCSAPGPGGGARPAASQPRGRGCRPPGPAEGRGCGDAGEVTKSRYGARWGRSAAPLLLKLVCNFCLWFEKPEVAPLLLGVGGCVYLQGTQGLQAPSERALLRQAGRRGRARPAHPWARGDSPSAPHRRGPNFCSDGSVREHGKRCYVQRSGEARGRLYRQSDPLGSGRRPAAVPCHTVPWRRGGVAAPERGALAPLVPSGKS